MNVTAFHRRCLACTMLLAGGCGTIPDIIADTARTSAKETLQGVVQHIVDGLIEDTVDELLGYADIEFPFMAGSEDEEDGDASEGADED